MDGQITDLQRAQAWGQLTHQQPYRLFKPWSKQEAFCRADYEYRLLAWSNRVGKTTVGSFEIVVAGMGQHGHIPYPAPPFTVWDVSVDYKQMRDSIIPSYEGDAVHPRVLPAGVTLNQQTMSYELPSGTVVRLKSAESGREAFQGAAPVIIRLDEELPETIINEIFVRFAGNQRRWIIWTLTGVSGYTWPYYHLYLPWLEYQLRGQQHPQIWYSEATMQEGVDAGILRQEDVDNLDQFYPPGSKELKVRKGGGFVDLAGDSLYSDQAIARHTSTIQKPRWRVSLRREKGQLRVENAHQWADWSVKVWHKPHPGCQYIIGADVAEGRLCNPDIPDSSRDWNVAAVYNRGFRRFDAFLACQINPSDFGRALYLLGLWYNRAWIVPEVNPIGIATLHILTGTSDPTYPVYSRIYQRRKDLDEWSEDTVADDLGFKTTLANRSHLYLTGAAALDFIGGNEPVTVYDDIAVSQMKTFQRDKKGKYQATTGHNDDYVTGMSLAIEGDRVCPVALALPDGFVDGRVPDGSDIGAYHRLLNAPGQPDEGLDMEYWSQDDVVLL